MTLSTLGPSVEKVMLEDHKIKDVWEEMKKVRATSDAKSRSKEGT